MTPLPNVTGVAQESIWPAMWPPMWPPLTFEPPPPPTAPVASIETSSNLSAGDSFSASHSQSAPVEDLYSDQLRQHSAPSARSTPEFQPSILTQRIALTQWQDHQGSGAPPRQ